MTSNAYFEGLNLLKCKDIFSLVSAGFRAHLTSRAPLAEICKILSCTLSCSYLTNRDHITRVLLIHSGSSVTKIVLGKSSRLMVNFQSIEDLNSRVFLNWKIYNLFVLSRQRNYSTKVINQMPFILLQASLMCVRNLFPAFLHADLSEYYWLFFAFRSRTLSFSLPWSSRDLRMIPKLKFKKCDDFLKKGPNFQGKCAREAVYLNRKSLYSIETRICVSRVSANFWSPWKMEWSPGSGRPYGVMDGWTWRPIVSRPVSRLWKIAFLIVPQDN